MCQSTGVGRAAQAVQVVLIRQYLSGCALGWWRRRLRLAKGCSCDDNIGCRIIWQRGMWIAENKGLKTTIRLTVNRHGDRVRGVRLEIDIVPGAVYHCDFLAVQDLCAAGGVGPNREEVSQVKIIE